MLALNEIEKTPDQIDVLVGANIKRIRLTCSMTQEFVANQMGITFQQFQKYESARNRISASRLKHLSDVLQCSILDFYDGADELIDKGQFLVKMPTAEEQNLLVLYRKIGSLQQRHVTNLIRGLAQSMKK